MNLIYLQLKLDRKIPVPLYYQLKQFMIENIKNNNFEEGEMVPTEEELCNLFKISRPTIRQAFSELVKDGYLDRIKAKGTFITKPKIEGNFFQKIESFNEEIEKKGMIPSTALLTLEKITPDEDILKKLNLNEGEDVIYMERVRYADQNPVVYVKTYVPAKNFKQLLGEDLKKNSFYEIMKEKFNVNASRVTRYVNAIMPDNYTGKLLKDNSGKPLLFISTVAFSEENIPFEYSLAYYRSDIYTMKLELFKNLNTD